MKILNPNQNKPIRVQIVDGEFKQSVIKTDYRKLQLIPLFRPVDWVDPWPDAMDDEVVLRQIHATKVEFCGRIIAKKLSVLDRIILQEKTATLKDILTVYEVKESLICPGLYMIQAEGMRS